MTRGFATLGTAPRTSELSQRTAHQSRGGGDASPRRERRRVGEVGGRRGLVIATHIDASDPAALSKAVGGTFEVVKWLL